MKSNLVRTVIFGVSLVLTANSFGNTKASFPIHSVVGNPLGARDNYTLNSKKSQDVSVLCRFINTGDTEADLKVWINPTAQEPETSIHLAAGKTAKPSIVSKKFTIKTGTHWWCLINLPDKEKMKLHDCGYLSISDAAIVTHNPFAVWKQVERPKRTSYQCSIQKPNKDLSFFPFVK
ncbi:MAG: hypothetical protein K0U12_07550 [Gammaproteobacteria bacterium]|nr:hypothetical protein [Gammaproteobacteria bacterium]